MNVLLTSVGRRNYLVDYFKAAVKPGGIVVAANSESLSSGMIVADRSYLVSRVDSSSYISEILDICRVEEVGLVVSLFDIDLPYLAKNRERFNDAGVCLAVSDPVVIDVVNDKWRTYLFLNEHGILTPKTFLDEALVRKSLAEGLLAFPLVVKPRWGMGSISVFRVENDEEFIFFYKYVQRKVKESYLNILSRDQLDKCVIVQECVEGNEYGLDVFNDLKGNHLQTIVKQKLAMRSGETDIAKVIDDARLSELGKVLAKTLRHYGNLDVDILENQKGDLFVLELNARFGGGYPFSHLAGANFPAALTSMAKGELVEAFSIDFECVGLKSINLIKA